MSPPTLSNALAEPEAPTLGGSGRRRGRAGAAVRRLPSLRSGMGRVPGAPGPGLLGGGGSGRGQTCSESWEATVEHDVTSD